MSLYEFTKTGQSDTKLMVFKLICGQKIFFIVNLVEKTSVNRYL